MLRVYIIICCLLGNFCCAGLVQADQDRPVSLLGGMVRLLLPSGFRPIAPDLLRAKYPELPVDTAELVATRDAAVTVGAYWSEQHFPEDIPSARPALSAQLRASFPEARWIVDELRVLDGRFFVQHTFIRNLPDGPCLTHLFITSYEQRLLIVAINAAGSQRQKWIQQGERVAASLALGR